MSNRERERDSAWSTLCAFVIRSDPASLTPIGYRARKSSAAHVKTKCFFTPILLKHLCGGNYQRHLKNWCVRFSIHFEMVYGDSSNKHGTGRAWRTLHRMPANAACEACSPAAQIIMRESHRAREILSLLAFGIRMSISVCNVFPTTLLMF